MSLIAHKNDHIFLEFRYSIEHFLNTKILSKLNKAEPNSTNIEFVELYTQDNGVQKIVYNTEQLTRQFMFHKVFPLSYMYTIFDYSSVNIDIIRNKNPNAKCVLFPILFSKPTMDLTHLKSDYEFDVMVIGTVTPRRYDIVKNLIERGLSVYVIDNCFDYELKYRMIFKAKVLLNVHADTDYNVFEFARCSVPIFNGCVVVSETSLNEKGSLINDYVISRVVFSNYNDIVDKVVDVVNNISQYEFNSDFEYLEELNTKDIIKIKCDIENILS